MRWRRRQSVLAEIPERRADGRPGALSRAQLGAFAGLTAALADAQTVLVNGPARSTVALGLAAAATVDEKRAALLECDLATPTLATTLGILPAPGLSEYLLGQVEARRILQPLVAAGPAADGASSALTCIVAGTAAPPAEALLGSERCRDAVEMMKRAYDLVVISAPGLEASLEAVRALADLADFTLFCGRRGELPRRLPAGNVGSVLLS